MVMAGEAKSTCSGLGALYTARTLERIRMGAVEKLRNRGRVTQKLNQKLVEQKCWDSRKRWL